MPYFEQGQEKLHVVYVQNENRFLDPNFQITCVKKRCITNSMSNYPKSCEIQLQHVKIQCEVGRLFICRVGKVYCGQDKLQCKFGKV